MKHQLEVAERLAQLRREKSARERRDVLQAEIALAAGVSVVTYGRYENGRRKIPDDVLIPLAQFYGVTPGFLRYGEGVERPVATEIPVGPAAIETLRTARVAKGATPKPQPEEKPQRMRKTAGERPRRGRPPNPK